MNIHADVRHSPQAQSHQPLYEWLMLFHIPGLGPKRLLTLLDALSSSTAIFAADPRTLATIVPERLAHRIAKAHSDPLIAASIERDLQWLEASSRHHIVPLTDSRYPPLLRAIDCPPPLLFVDGDVTLLNQRQIAVVGSRQPTPQGLASAQRFGGDLANAEYVVTSGLAIGIDGAAHSGALSVPTGRTVAALASGVDNIYPQRHNRLAADIAEQGALVSEFALGTPPRAGHFPRRNRIISGLSLGTLVVEAAVASGSLVTARYALEQGREVFAMPGSVNNPLAQGCHALIRDGAVLVENTEQLLFELEGINTALWPLEQIRRGEETKMSVACPDQQKVLAALGFEACHHDELMLATGFSSDKLAGLLLVMELEGIIHNSPQGIMRLCR